MQKNNGQYVIVILMLFTVNISFASQPEISVLEGFGLLAQGRFDGITLDQEAKLQIGEGVETIASRLPGPIIAMVRAENNVIYAATAGPAKLWQIEKGQEPKVVFTSDKPLITSIGQMSNGDLAWVVAPEGGVYFAKPGQWDKARYIAISDVNILLGADVFGDRIYLVGGGETGRLLRLSSSTQKIDVLATVDESHLRSVYVDRHARGEVVYFGSAERGIIYRYENGHTSSVFSGIGEITSLVKDGKGRLFASIVDSEGHKLLQASARARSADNGDSNLDLHGRPERDIRSSEVLRVDSSGEVDVLWQSRSDGVYAIALSQDEGRLLFGTGPNGLLYRVDADGKRGAEILLSKDEHQEISTLLRGEKNQFYLGTAYQGGVFRLDESSRPLQGTYVSPILDMGTVAKLGAISVKGNKTQPPFVRTFVRVGNTATPDQTWSPFVERNSEGDFEKLPLAKKAQVKLLLSRKSAADATPTVNQVRIGYLNLNRPPKIGVMRILAPNEKLSSVKTEGDMPRTVTLDEYAFANANQPLSFAPMQRKLLQAMFGAESGYRSIYVWAEDPDNDVLRYQFVLEHIGTDGKSNKSSIIKPWSEEPHAAIDSFKMADGRYRVRVYVDDLLTNGPARGLKDTGVSDIFEIANSLPVFENTYAKSKSEGTQVYFVAHAKVPLAIVKCSIDGEIWMPVDPKDGITDENQETYEFMLTQKPRFGSVSCEAVDENENRNRVDINIKDK